MRDIIDAMKKEVADLDRAAEALRYSWERCHSIRFVEGLSQEELERLEALTGRFARLSDILVQRIFRYIDTVDLEPQGTARDRIHRAEKRGIIASAEDFIRIRLLRNEISHEYKTDTLYGIFEKVLDLTPVLLKGVEGVLAYVDDHASAWEGHRGHTGMA